MKNNIFIATMPQSTQAYGETFLDLKKCWVEVTDGKCSFIKPTPQDEIDALNNVIDKAEIVNMFNMLFKGLSNQPLIKNLSENQLVGSEQDGLYVAYLEGGFTLPGAGILAVPSLLHKIGIGFGASYYIIPSSQKELIVFSENNEIGKGTDNLVNVVHIIKDMNTTDCVGELKLSDNLYRYDLSTGEVNIVKLD